MRSQRTNSQPSGGPTDATTEAQHKASLRINPRGRQWWAGLDGDTPQRLVLASGNPRVPVSVTRGFPALLYMMVKYGLHPPSPRPLAALQPRLRSEPGLQSRMESWPWRVLGQAQQKQHPHRLQCSGGGLFADVGRTWQGPLGLASKGAISRLETDSPSQVRGRAQELAVCVMGVGWRIGPNLY